MTREYAKNLLPLKLLLDANAWQILGENEIYILLYIFCSLLLCSKKRTRATDFKSAYI